ncbi:MAG: Gfo/Idh/MocA family protein [bacterium]
MLKVGIIGCGGIARTHMEGYLKLAEKGEVKVRACSDIDKERAKEFAQKYDIPKAYGDFNKMLEGEKLDIVSVCTPNYAHKEPTIRALKLGVNVLCEKPIAMSAEDALEMVEAAERSKALLTIGHHQRFGSEAQALKRFIDGGELGEIYFGRAQALRRRGIPGWGVFHIKAKSGGGTLIDIGVHAIDLVLWLMGSPEPESVSGTTYCKFGRREDAVVTWGGNYNRSEFDVEDFAAAFVRLKNGATMIVESSWATEIEGTSKYTQQILGDRGGATLNPFGVYTQMHGCLVDITPHSLPEVKPHNEEIAWFAACVRGEKEVLVKPRESYNVQRIIDGIYKSSETRREVLL